MITVAQIEGINVINVFEWDSASPPANGGGVIYIDVTTEIPIPSAGWFYIESIFIPPNDAKFISRIDTTATGIADIDEIYFGNNFLILEDAILDLNLEAGSQVIATGDFTAPDALVLAFKGPFTENNLNDYVDDGNLKYNHNTEDLYIYDDPDTFDLIEVEIIPLTEKTLEEHEDDVQQSEDHTHDNKTELDKLTVGDHDVIQTGNPHQVDKDNIGLGNVPNLDTTDAVNNQHGHTNKVEIDKVTVGDHDVISTGNPHDVNKGDVGLSDVTNDAQLKRASGDINSFTEKTTIDDNDVLLIEDSENSYAKKKVKLSNIGGGGSGATSGVRYLRYGTDSKNKYFGFKGSGNAAVVTTNYIDMDSTITNAYATYDSVKSCYIYIRINNTTEHTLELSADSSSGEVEFNSLNVSLSDGDTVKLYHQQSSGSKPSNLNVTLVVTPN